MTRAAAGLALGCLALGGLAPAPDQSTSRAVPPHPRGYVASRASAAPAIDGRLDDPAWQRAAWTDLFVDIEGDARPKPRFDTRVKMLWDDAFFYIGADLTEPHLWATLREHDSVIFRDHDFEVFIDPNGDNHEYYEFEINALGTFWDLLLPKPYKDDGKAVNAWEIPGLKSAVRLNGTLNDPGDTDRGWSVELAFPWKALGEVAHRPAPPRDGDQWRVNFSRVEWPTEVVGGRYQKPAGAREANWVWSPQGVIDMHRPDTWGYVQFSTAPPGRAAFVPDPNWPARAWLHRVYYAEREYRRANGRWADSLAALGLGPPSEPGLSGATLGATGDLFQACVWVMYGKELANRFCIRQDSLVWSGGKIG